MYENWPDATKEHQNYTNVFTFSAHLVLSQDQATYYDIREVAQLTSGWHPVRDWVHHQLQWWFKVDAPGRSPYHENNGCLIAEIAGDAFGYVCWEDLCSRLSTTGQPTLRDPENPFTDFLFSFLLATYPESGMYQGARKVLTDTYDRERTTDPEGAFFTAVDAVQNLFDVASDEWTSMEDRKRSPTSPMTALMKGFVEIWLELVDWSDVADQFRKEEGQ